MQGRELKELLDTVEKLNYELYEVTGDDDWSGFTVLSNGIVFEVEFLGFSVWSSENDTRLYDNNFEDENFEGFLRKAANKVLNKLMAVKF